MRKCGDGSGRSLSDALDHEAPATATARTWDIVAREELTRESMVEPGKELFGVSVRRTLGGAPWDCGTNASSKDELAKAEKLCLSLRAAK